MVTVYSAQELTATRICAAERCPNDAEPQSRLCAKCAQLDSVTLHTTPPINTTPGLTCCTCHQWKPDDHFTLRTHIKAQHRRHRSAECRECANQRRRSQRATAPKQQCAALCSSTRHKRGGKQCRNYARHDSAYCPAHTPKEAS